MYGMEDPHRVGPAAHAGDHGVRVAARRRRHLRQAFLADHALEIAHHHRVRVRPGDGADDVEGRFDVRHPVAHRFVERILQRLRAGQDGDDGRAEELHPEHVLRLPFHVLRAHVDHAFHAEARGDGRGRNAVLPGTGLGNHALLAEALGEQRLTDAVVDLVRAGVIEVLALEPDLRAARLFRPALRVVDRRRPADIVRELVLEFADEIGILPVARVLRGELVERAHQRLGDEDAAVGAEVAARIGEIVR